MPRFRVVITDMIDDDMAPERGIFGEHADIVALNAKAEHELFGQIEEAEGLLIYTIPFSAACIERLKQCKAIVRCGVGFDNIDRVFARTRGIPVTNVPDYGTEEIAETAIGMMLSLCRGLHVTNSRLQRGVGRWHYREAGRVHRLRGRVFGMIGLGRIGMATAIRAKAFGMDVVFYDPYVADGLNKALGIRRVETLPELLRQSHAVSVHTPLTPETKHIVDAAAIALMPRGSYLINTARGACVDTAAIAPAIASGQLSGVGIDVLPTEPPADDDPLLMAWRDPNHPAYDRLILNPHGAFYSEEGLLDMRVKGAQTLLRALLGEPYRNVVN